MGCDQVISYKNEIFFAERMSVEAEFYNNDGSPAESCGNGTRCLVKLLKTLNPSIHTFHIKTKGGELEGYCESKGMVKISLPPVKSWPLKEKLPCTLPSSVQPVVVTVGNPHLVLLGYKPAQKAIETVGPLLENQPLFSGGINISFATVMSESQIDLTVWERGAGLTQACGTGACATAIVAQSQGMVNFPVTVQQFGGVVKISLEKEKLWLTGEATIVFEGIFL